MLRAAVYVLPSTLTSTRQVYFPESSCEGPDSLMKPLSDTEASCPAGAVSWQSWCHQNQFTSRTVQHREQPHGAQMHRVLLRTFTQRMLLVRFRSRTSLCLQDRSSVTPTAMDLVSGGSGHFAVDTDTPKVTDRDPVWSLKRRTVKPSQASN